MFYTGIMGTAATLLTLALLGGCAATSETPSQGHGMVIPSEQGQNANRMPVDTATDNDHKLPAAEASAQAELIAERAAQRLRAVDDYRIGPQDLLEVEVFQVEELSRTVRVNSRGAISLPLIGIIHAAGLSSEELEAVIAARLAKEYLQSPHVSIFIKEYTSQRVTVEGAVNKPGIYPLKGQTTLLQAIAIAEGLGELADVSRVKLFRNKPEAGRTVASFDLEKIRSGDAEDPIVQGDDIIVVEESTSRSVIKGVSDTIRGIIGLRPI